MVQSLAFSQLREGYGKVHRCRVCANKQSQTGFWEAIDMAAARWEPSVFLKQSLRAQFPLFFSHCARSKKEIVVKSRCHSRGSKGQNSTVRRRRPVHRDTQEKNIRPAVTFLRHSGSMVQWLACQASDRTSWVQFPVGSNFTKGFNIGRFFFKNICSYPESNQGPPV